MTLLVGRQEGHLACKKTEWWGAGIVMCLGQGADFAYGAADATATHYLLLKYIQIILPFWCRLTQVVLEKIQEGHKTVVCVCEV